MTIVSLQGLNTLFFTDGSIGGAVREILTNGSGLQTIVPSALAGVLTNDGSKLFILSGSGVFSSDIDGSNFTQIVTVTNPRGITILNDRLYFTVTLSTGDITSIQSSKKDGTDLVTIFDQNDLPVGEFDFAFALITDGVKLFVSYRTLALPSNEVKVATLNPDGTGFTEIANISSLSANSVISSLRSFTINENILFLAGTSNSVLGKMDLDGTNFSELIPPPTSGIHLDNDGIKLFLVASSEIFTLNFNFTNKNVILGGQSSIRGNSLLVLNP